MKCKEIHHPVYVDAQQTFQHPITWLTSQLSISAIVNIEMPHTKCFNDTLLLEQINPLLLNSISQSKCQCSADGSLVVTATEAGIVSIFVTPSLFSDSLLASVFISTDTGSSLTPAVVSCF